MVFGRADSKHNKTQCIHETHPKQHRYHNTHDNGKTALMAPEGVPVVHARLMPSRCASPCHCFKHTHLSSRLFAQPSHVQRFLDKLQDRASNSPTAQVRRWLLQPGKQHAVPIFSLGRVTYSQRALREGVRLKRKRERERHKFMACGCAAYVWVHKISRQCSCLSLVVCRSFCVWGTAVSHAWACAPSPRFSTCPTHRSCDVSHIRPHRGVNPSGLLLRSDLTVRTLSAAAMITSSDRSRAW